MRSGRLYRSDSLAKLDGADLQTFGTLGIRTVIDLQRPAEVEVHGHIDLPGLRYLNIAPDHEMWVPGPYDEIAGPARYLADRYLDMARDGYTGFVAVLDVIADADNSPTVVHCFAGKDRTGVLMALTLSLLGVNDDDIATDYAISDEWSSTNAPAELPMHWVVAPREAMVLFLQDLNTKYGSAEQYVLDAGLPPSRITALRSHLLG